MSAGMYFLAYAGAISLAFGVGYFGAALYDNKRTREWCAVFMLVVGGADFAFILWLLTRAAS